MAELVSAYPDGRRHLLVGVEARRPGLGLVHRLVQPARPDRDPRLGRLLRAASSWASILGLYNVNIFGIELRRRRARAAGDVPALRAHPARCTCSSTSAAATSSRCSTASPSAGTSLGVAVIVGDPDLRARQARERQLRLHRHDQQLRASATAMFWWYVLPLGFLLTQYTITGFDASAHISEETHGADECRAARASGGRSSTRRSSATSCCWRSRSPRPTRTRSPRAAAARLAVFESAMSAGWVKVDPDHRRRSASCSAA